MSRSNRSLADASGSVAALLRRGGRTAYSWLVLWWRTSAQTARLAIGIPDYDNYVDHIRRHHPERKPMDRDTFFHERMLARYGKGRSRCC